MKYSSAKNNFKIYMLIFEDIYSKANILKEFYFTIFFIILKEKAKKFYYWASAFKAFITLRRNILF